MMTAHDNPQKLLEQGELYFQQGDHKLAEKHFLNMIHIYPNLAEAHNNLGVIYCQTNQLQKSIEHFKIALSIDPQNQDAITNLQQIIQILGPEETNKKKKSHPENTERIKIIDDIEKTVPLSNALITPFAFKEQHDWFEDEIGFIRNLIQPGMTVVEENLTNEPNHAEELLKQGETCFQDGNMELAEQHFLKAVLKNPGLVDAYNNLGVIYWQRSKLETSLIYFRKALNLDPVNQDAIANLKGISNMLEKSFQEKSSQTVQTSIPPVQSEKKTAALSKLLVSSFVSAPLPGKSPGGLYFMDLEDTQCEQVIDLNDLPLIGEKKRNKGIKGLALYQDQICMVAGDRLFIHNKDFKLIGTHDSPYLKDCQGIFASGNRLFLTSTGFESILVFDFLSRKFVEGYHVNYSKTANSINLLPFNPQSGKGPVQNNTIDLNSICIQDNLLYFSCQKLDRLFCVQENGAIHSAAKIPLGTQTARPHKAGFLITDANGKTLVHQNFNGKVIDSFKIPTPVKDDHDPTPVLKFSGEICVTNDDLIIASAFPATILAYKSGDSEPAEIATLNIETIASIGAFAAWA